MHWKSSKRNLKAMEKCLNLLEFVSLNKNPPLGHKSA